MSRQTPAVRKLTPANPPASTTRGVMPQAAMFPRATPAMPPKMPRARASSRMICITWVWRKPMARKMPISRVRSFTDPIMVTMTSSAPTPTTSTDTPKENDLNSSMDCILDITACFMAVTRASGNFSAICRVSSVMGQPRQKAAISTMDTLPGLPKTAWAAVMSAITAWSSAPPVGMSTPDTSKTRPPVSMGSPGARPSTDAAVDPSST